MKSTSDNATRHESGSSTACSKYTDLEEELYQAVDKMAALASLPDRPLKDLVRRIAAIGDQARETFKQYQRDGRSDPLKIKRRESAKGGAPEEC